MSGVDQATFDKLKPLLGKPYRKSVKNMRGIGWTHVGAQVS